MELTRIQRRAGHDNIQTTLGYLKMAEDLTGKVGTPFVGLPFAPMTGNGSAGCRSPIGPSMGQEAAIRNEAAENSLDDQLPTGACSGRIVTEVVIDYFEAKKRLRQEERTWEPPPILKTLALAEDFQRRIAAGEVTRADLARLHRITRARVTQVLNLLRLHPAIIAFLRAQPADPHARQFTEHRVRALLRLDHDRQLGEASRLWRGFVPRDTSRRTG